MAAAAPEKAVGARTVRRVAWLIALFGAAASLAALALRRWDFAAGVAIGAALAWLNFRWLRRGLQALTAAAASGGKAAKGRGQAAIYFTALFRYGLIGLAVYVIFAYLHIPLLSLVLGLCTLAAAILAASIWEILQSTRPRS